MPDNVGKFVEVNSIILAQFADLRSKMSPKFLPCIFVDVFVHQA